ncbi:MAG: TetR/AcrR family transcriptional regulator [Proteobacteria bacterium]|nr:MAG: TetR/AcrR family transcriptional regulator [Pseudomonadota bacterium]
MASSRTRRPRVTPRKRPAQARSRETVRAVLEAAARIFEERGAAAATTDAIARRAGVSIGSLYQYWPSKEALLAELGACHVLAAHAALAPARERLARGAPPDEAIPALVGAMVDLHASRPRLHRVLWEDGVLGDDARHAVAALHRSVCDALARWLAARHDVDVSDAALAARVACDALAALAHGVALSRRGGAAPRAVREIETLLRRYLTGRD